MDDDGSDDYELACPTEVPSYDLRLGDLAGIYVTWLGNICVTTGGALHAIGREFYAATNKRREVEAEVADRRTLEQHLARLVEESTDD